MYISSACVKNDKIIDSVEQLALNGFRHIELSGGTHFYDTYEEDLLSLKEKYQLDYLVHNYFPPPKEDLILNLASLDEDIFQRSLGHYLKAIHLSRKLGAKKFGFHAGIYIDFSAREIGKSISLATLRDKEQAKAKFCEGYRHLKANAQGVDLYIENHVLSSTNCKTFGGENPFMLTDFQAYVELRSQIDFKLLLDVAHLYVSAHSLKLNFEDQLKSMIAVADYVHFSDNDGLHDQNRCFREESEMLALLRKHHWDDHLITVETYDSIETIKQSHDVLQRVLSIH